MRVTRRPRARHGLTLDSVLAGDIFRLQFDGSPVEPDEVDRHTLFMRGHSRGPHVWAGEMIPVVDIETGEVLPIPAATKVIRVNCEIIAYVE